MPRRVQVPSSSFPQRSPLGTDELEALQTVTAHFAGSSDGEPVRIVDTVLTLGLQLVGAVSGAVLVDDADVEGLPSFEESVSYPPDLLERLRRWDGRKDALAGIAGTRGRQPVFLESLDEVRERCPAMLPVLPRSGGSAALVPLFRAGDRIGRLLLAFHDERRVPEERTEAVLALGRLCEEALAHSHRQRVERRIAETLQRSLLPARLADVPGLDVAVRYLPRAAETDVGGDWYDQLVLDDGRVVLTVGDVAGSGITAAAVMARLRIVLKAYAVDGRSPAKLLSQLDDFVEYLPEECFATAVVLRVDPATGAVEYAVAGHPPPLLIPGTGGAARYLEEARSVPIDTCAGSILRTEAAIELSPGDALLLYTDGLVERRDLPIAEGMSLLSRVLRRSRGDSAEKLVRRATDALLGNRPVADDVALLAVRLRNGE